MISLPAVDLIKARLQELEQAFAVMINDLTVATAIECPMVDFGRHKPT